jgi:hypothetical protein
MAYYYQKFTRKIPVLTRNQDPKAIRRPPGIRIDLEPSVHKKILFDRVNGVM